MSQNFMKNSVPREILQRLKGVVTKLIFNIEAATDTVYNKIMGTVDCFHFLQTTVRDAVSYGITCEAHFVPMKYNVNEIEKTLQFCQNMGISRVSFLRLVPHGRALLNKDSILLADTELEELKQRLLTLQKQGRYTIRIGVPLAEQLTEVHCEAAVGKLNIKYDGFVYPCEVFKNINKLSSLFGTPDNIYEKDMETIYYQSLYLNHVRDFITTFCQSDNCENCVGQFFIQDLQEKDGERDGK